MGAAWPNRLRRIPAFWRQDGPWAHLLAPLSFGYQVVGQAYRQLATPRGVNVPVICVGNIVVGGAGKTPVVLSLLTRLQALGFRPFALTRGYGGSAQGPLEVDPARHDAGVVGDEALLLARAAPTWLAKDRVAGARAAVAAGAQLLVLDDGYQNPWLKKDLSLVVVDSEFGFGNGRLLPAGPLREPLAAGLARANGVVLLGDGSDALVSQFSSKLPILRARVRPRADGMSWKGRRVLAFTGIARPEKFYASLVELGADLVATRDFPDHYPFSPDEVEALLAEAASRDAVAVTTEKDAMRLSPPYRVRVATLPIQVEWEDPVAIDALLGRLVSHG